ncbi:hypothetical protein O7635_00080 [Asanoa sp. WMMD1127]|uniref:hypothetical protein n=1 Tax=Asanoa sp. WMMD1127 TaxID=3016107 RepID=UPI0024171DEF|nr:hypothetical protein [Asanoa sp. WMMD1127]MDG4820268.1 hypothetical protein [Asanoa sp. WMMD1127]
MIGIALASLALGVSLFTVLMSRRQQRLNAFLQMQQQMLAAEMKVGRKLVYKASQTGQLPVPDSAEFAAAVRALNMFDVCGMYIRHGIIPRRWVLEYWHRRLRELETGFDAMLLEREAWHPGWEPWPDLRRLFESARRYRCKEVCCRALPAIKQTAADEEPPVRVGGSE